VSIPAEVTGYELVLAKTQNEQWSVSLQGNGHFVTPLHEIYESLDDAKHHACVWAAKESETPLTEDLLERAERE
jgi:hypothetical protein